MFNDSFFDCLIPRHFTKKCFIGLAFISFFSFNAQATTYRIHVDSQPLTVEIAQTPKEQRRGLQYCMHLPESHGMLFVFLNPREVCMWMRHVPIDLDVAFFNEKMQLVNIESMKRQTDRHHCSQGKAAYVLEVNQGWFKRHRIKPGAILKLD